EMCRRRPRSSSYCDSSRSTQKYCPAVQSSCSPSRSKTTNSVPFATSCFSLIVARTAYVRPETVSWFSAWRIRCSSCQRSALDSLELGLRLLELPARTLVVDLLRANGVVDEGDRAVELHLEEAWAGGEFLHLVGVPVGVHARRARLQCRDQRRVAREDADVTGCAGDDDHLRLALERRPLGSHE